ncbi:hypothetical protein [Streptomyces sp. NPDC091217]|uniref:hypothetical protein n=1 Tax=Streptomyces sp. NPDC091217 TaxID=3365975 RepID=UPI00380D62D4
MTTTVPSPVKRSIRSLAADTDLWLDDVRMLDSTPAECARSRFHWGLNSAWCALLLILADKGYIAVELGRMDHDVVIT